MKYIVRIEVEEEYGQCVDRVFHINNSDGWNAEEIGSNIDDMIDTLQKSKEVKF